MYIVTAYCIAPDCRCDDRRGVIVYRGYDRAEAESRAAEWTRDDYRAEIDIA